MHFRENALDCQDAKSLLRDAKMRDKRLNGGLSQYPQRGKSRLGGIYDAQLEPAGCHSASMPSRPRRSTAWVTPACSSCRAMELKPSASSVIDVAVRRN